MAICVKCNNEALQGGDYCGQCEEKAFMKIGGWLWLPAIGLVVSVLTNLVSFTNTLKIVMENHALLSAPLLGVIGFELFSFAALALASGYIFSLFVRKKRQLPRFYIALLVAGLVYIVLDLVLASALFEAKIDFDDVRTLLRGVVGACIWIPYFLVSVRVKRTFIH